MAIIKHKKRPKDGTFPARRKEFSPLFLNYFPADADREF